jgi:hypothetical protein
VNKQPILMRHPWASNGIQTPKTIIESRGNKSNRQRVSSLFDIAKPDQPQISLRTGAASHKAGLPFVKKSSMRSHRVFSLNEQDIRVVRTLAIIPAAS